MSAIAGIFSLDERPVAPADLERMSEALAVWGPDEAGIWSEGPVGLVQRLLCTTPESLTQHRPLLGRSGKLVLTADARIDNRSELIAALALDDRRASELGDGELILAAYERWGEECPQRLLGDFAFAIWDLKNQRLFCARDPMGVRPFFYHRSDRLFVFATQISPLLRLKEVPRRLNERTLAEFLALLPPTRAETFYRDIQRLPPAHALIVTRENQRLWSYWDLDLRRELRLRSDEEYAEAFRGIFVEAVRSRLRSSQPIAAMLSGGLDSSSIVSTARQLLPPDQRLITLSAVFPAFRATADRVDEKQYIDAVVAGGRVDARFVRADGDSPLLDFLWQGEEPIPAAALYMDWAIFKAANDFGVRALLSGNDGDSVVGYGYAYLAELVWRGKLPTFFDELYALSRMVGVPRRALLRRFVFPTFVPAGVMRVWKRWHENGGPVYDTRSVIRPEFAARTGVSERIRELQVEERAVRLARKAHWYSITSPLLTMLTETLARGCAEFSLEPRYPFFDRRLMEFCLSLPGHQKLNQGWNRVVMRRAMEGILPPEIQWRSNKQDLSPNFNLRLLEFERELLDDVVSVQPDCVADYIEDSALRKKYERYTENPRRTRDGFAVFWAIIFTLWLRRSGLTP